MSSSKYVGQLKQNNIQINSLRGSNDRAEKHMLEHEQALTEKQICLWNINRMSSRNILMISLILI